MAEGLPIVIVPGLTCAARLYASQVAGARYVVVPNCAHLSTIEQPEAVSAALAEWLGK